MDVTTLYTNKPQKKGIETLCRAFDSLKKKQTEIPIHTPLLERALRLVLQESSFQLIQWEKKTIYRRSKTALGTKMTVACANILMSKVETNILNRKKCVKLKPLVWKRFIDVIWEFKHTTFLSQMVTGSQLLPCLTYLHTTTFILLSIFHSCRRSVWKSGRDHSPGMGNVHFRFLFVAKKHRLLKLSILSQWNANRREMTIFIENANISITRQQNSRLKYLKPKLVVVYKDNRFVKESLPHVGKHFLATATFQCTHFCSNHPPGVKRD